MAPSGLFPVGPFVLGLFPRVKLELELVVYAVNDPSDRSSPNLYIRVRAADFRAIPRFVFWFWCISLGKFPLPADFPRSPVSPQPTVGIYSINKKIEKDRSGQQPPPQLSKPAYSTDGAAANLAITHWQTAHNEDSEITFSSKGLLRHHQSYMASPYTRTGSRAGDDKNSDMYYTVDIRSDTLSTPTPEMRRAMAEAVVGDDVYGEDPTVNKLERRSAELLNKEAGLFVPSGTMANLLAIMVHCSRRGAEAIVGDLSHTFLYEQASAAQIAGVQLATVKNNPDGTFSLDEVVRKIRSRDLHEPITSLVIVENTHNMCGGKVLPLEWLAALAALCKEHRLPLHMDGARVFNAAEALNLPVASIVQHFDSVCFCLSKGLSAPVGSILVGSKDFIKEARRLRKALGGGMRQVGILAAAGLVALDTIVPGLGKVHQKVRRIAEAIDGALSPNIKVDLANVQTNILLIEMARGGKIQSDKFAARLATVTQKELENKITDEQGRGIVVKVSSRDWSFARIVLYEQITDKDVDLTIKKLLFVIHEFDETIYSTRSPIDSAPTK